MQKLNSRAGFSFARSRSTRRFIRIAAAALPLLSVAHLAWADGSTWTFNGDGNWTTAANWNNGAPNSATTDAVIDDGDSAVNVTLNATQTVHNFSLGSNDNLSLSNNTSLVVDGPTITNSGTITIVSAGNLTDLNIGTNSTLTGGGTISLTNNQFSRIVASVSGLRLTNVNNVIQGFGQLGADGLAVTNQSGGLISANLSGLSLTIDPVATALDAGAAFLNQGTMQAASGGALVLGNGLITNSGIIRALTGSQVQLANGAAVTGGTLTTAGTGSITVNSNIAATISNLTNAGSLIISNNAALHISGTINNTATIATNGTGNLTDLQVDGSATLTGGGAVVLDSASSRVTASTSGSRLVNVNNVIQGFGQLGTDSLAITNQVGGVIDGNSTVGALSIDPVVTATDLGAAFINQGTIQASNTGSIFIGGGTITNSGVVRALAGSRVFLGNAGAINGGTLTTLGDGTISVASNIDAYISNLTNAGSFIINNNSALHVAGTITNSGSMATSSIGNTTDIRIDSAATFTGGGTITLDSPTSRITTSTSGLRFTNVNNLIQGRGLVGTDTTAFTNQIGGVINANSSGGNLVLDAVVSTADAGASFINQGTMQASNGGILVLTGGGGGTFSNSGIIRALTGSEVQLTSGASVGGGTFTSSGTGLVRVNQNTEGSITDVTNAGTFIVSNNSVLHVYGTTNNTGTVIISTIGNNTDLRLETDGTFSGGGTIILDSTSSRLTAGSSGLRFTNSDNTIQGLGQIGINSLAITNKGLINANAGTNTTLTLDPSNVASAFVNQGTLQASQGGALMLTGSGGGAFTNTGHVIQALTGSVVQLNANVSIVGGTLQTSGTGSMTVLQNQTVSLTGVTNSGSILVDNNSDLHIIDSLANQGSITMFSIGNTTRLVVDNSLAISGNGTITLSNNGAAGIAAGTTGVRLTSSNVINGLGLLGNDGLAITNLNLVDANAAGQSLTINPVATALDAGDSFINAGTVQASNGALLILTGSGGGTFTNTGHVIQALNGSEVQLGANAQIVGGTLQVAGTGTFHETASQEISLYNLTTTGALQVDNNSVLHASGTLNNTGSITLISGGNSTDFRLDTSTALTGAGTLFLTGHDAVRISSSSAGLRLTNSNVISGRGQIGVNNTAFTNLNLIDSNVAGGAMTIDPVGTAADAGLSFANLGTVQASNGGLLILTGSGGGIFTNTGHYIQALTGSEVRLQAGATLTGGTLAASGTGFFHVPDSQDVFLSDLTNAASFQVDNNTFLHISGIINNIGSINIHSGGNNTQLRIDNNATLTGNGTVILADSSAVGIGGSTGGLRLVNSGNYIQGRGTIGQDNLAVTNQGIIHANVSGAPLIIDPPNVTDGFLNDTTGTLRASGGGILSLTGNGGGVFTNNGIFEALDGGNLTMDASASLTNNVAGVLTGGTYRAVSTGNGAVLTIQGSNITQIAGSTTVELNGSGSTFQVGTNALETNLAINNGTLKIFGTRTYNNVNAFANGSSSLSTAILQMGGGTFNAPTLINETNSSILGFGLIVPRPTNHGLVQSSGGTLAFSNGVNGGSGTIQATGGSTVDLSAGTSNSSADALYINANGNLNVGSNSVLVAVDYANSNFGTGNSFNPHANVFGSGQILASPAVSQTLTGNVNNGTTTTPTMDFGNLRVGSTSFKTYAINNVGASGPAIRGAIQTNNTAGNGGNITDGRLAGAGVTAANFGSITTGSATGSETITFNATSSGALTGQKVAIVNNFDNVSEQLLTVTGAAYNPAVGSVTPGSIAFGNFHVGDAVTAQALAIANLAPAGVFSEDLLADTITANPDALLGIGSPTSVNVLAGGSNGSVTVAVSTTSAGNKSGTVTMNLKSNATVNGTAIPGLSPLALGSATVNVNATVYRLATAGLPAGSINLGQYHVNDTATGTIVVGNTSANDAFSEKLKAQATGFTADLTSAAGTATITAGSNSGSLITTQISTATAGAKSGTASIQLTSIAGGAGLSNTNLGTAAVNVQATVFNLAQSSVVTPQPINFGIVHTGDVVPQQAISVKNAANIGSYSENLDVAFGTLGTNITSNGGSISLLAAQSTDSTDLKVGINTSSHHSIAGSAQLVAKSNGSGIDSLGTTSLASSPVVNIIGQVNDYASPFFSKLSGLGTLTSTGASTYTLDFGSVAQNSSALSDLRLLNAVTNPADNLGGSFLTGGTSYSYTGFGAFSPLTPGGTLDNLDVTLDTTSPGAFGGTISFSPTSINANFNGPLSLVTINVTGIVTAVPEPTMILPLALAGVFFRRRRRA